MFRNRRNSQKPTNELYAAFKQTFPHVGPGTTRASSAASTESVVSLTSTTASVHQIMDQRHEGDNEGNKDHDHDLGDPDHWRFTPSILDTNSYDFTSFANQHAEGFTSALGVDLSGITHNQAGGLHTPGIGFGLETPLSMSHPENHSSSASAIDMHGFHSHLLYSQPYHDKNPFAQPQSFAPSSFMHRDSGYETMSGVPNGANRDKMAMVQKSTNFAAYAPKSFDDISTQAMQSMDNLRYQVTLNAPTAMVKHSDEIPITYLNKGQAYVVSISDSMGLRPAQSPLRYRTVIRISFEDEQQRQSPAACWQLWKEGRGLAEAHQRGGRLQAVEYVDSNHHVADEDNKRPRVELEKASFDCFSVIWSPFPSSCTAACSIAVRFNFLSTDFSHSKGVKGIPVRLCAKTEFISSSTPDSPPGPTSEVCFCKVKLFRDHGAERKLSNDVAHIKKTIDKVKQQITQVESGVRDTGKRKRSGGDKSGSHRPEKVHKHKRAWSVSSQGSNGRPAVEEDLHLKLETIQDMFSSTRPVSVLYLKGYEEDDPDVYPVSLPGGTQALPKSGQSGHKPSWEHREVSDSTPTNSCVVSPSSSSRSMPSDSRPSESSIIPANTTIKPQQHLLLEDWQQAAIFSTENSANFHHTSVKIPRADIDDTSVPRWIDAFDVDPTYRAPPVKTAKPVACFYVLVQVPGTKSEEKCFKAVYLMERTVQDFATNIAIKCDVNPSHILKIFRINSKGLKIIVDDDVVREVAEGQDMIVEFNEVDTTTGLKHESKSEASTPRATGVLSTTSATANALEMILLF